MVLGGPTAAGGGLHTNKTDEAALLGVFSKTGYVSMGEPEVRVAGNSASRGCRSARSVALDRSGIRRTQPSHPAEASGIRREGEARAPAGARASRTARRQPLLCSPVV